MKTRRCRGVQDLVQGHTASSVGGGGVWAQSADCKIHIPLGAWGWFPGVDTACSSPACSQRGGGRPLGAYRQAVIKPGSEQVLRFRELQRGFLGIHT